MGWTKFAVGEGLAKTASALSAKLIGTTGGSLPMAALAGLVIGSIQCLSGFVGFLSGRRRTTDQTIAALFPDWRSVRWAILFGLMASLFGTIWSIYTFTLGADIGIRTLLIMGSIIPGAILDRIFWREKLRVAQILGIAVFLTAAWAMLDFPALTTILALPIWVPAVLVITCTQAINEALSRAASIKLNHWVNNFWVGGTTVFSCLAAIMVMASIADGLTLNPTPVFVGGALLSGIIVVPMIAFKLLSYKGGGTIAMKKIIMQGTYLVGAVTAGIVVYHEPFTTGKVVGTTLFFVSVTLTQGAKLWSARRN